MATVLLDGLGFPESPRWHDGRLWLCNWNTQEVLAVDTGGTAATATVEAIVATTIPYSIDWLPDGRMLVVSGQEAVLLVREDDGTLAPYADLSPFAATFNEIVIASDGTAYVNGEVIVAVRPDGTVRQVADALAFGNGMALTDDGRTLIVAESHGNCLTAFDVGTDGTLANRRIWADLAGDNPDGICLDAEGAVWYASVPGRHCVRVREGGEVLQTVEVDRGCFACMLGGPDGRTLFVLAAQWRGMAHMFDGDRTGRVLAEQVRVRSGGRP